MKRENYPTPETSKRNVWGIVLKVIITVATAIAGALGIQACHLL
ncbi:MAG: smalltalk protein [Parabacteroides sp.]|nr:smalltalk protein [Parabacteroides sp.]